MKMINVIERASHLVTGGQSFGDIAQEWTDAGLTPEQASDYIGAGCWDAGRTAKLIAAGITALQLTDRDVAAAYIAARNARAAERGGRYTREDMTESLAYMHSNGDATTDEIKDAVAEVYES